MGHEYPEGRLREALEYIISHECDGARAITVDRDYRFRMAWLLTMFGDARLEDLSGRAGYDELHRVWKLGQADGLKNVTIRRRFKFLLRALRAAAARELMDVTRIPPLPRMKNDGEPRTEYHTLEQHRLVRAALACPFQRAGLDLAFWTGMHRHDLDTTELHHIDFDRQFNDDAGAEVGRGGWLMRNHKNDVAHWLPLDDEFRDSMREYLPARSGARLLVGKMPQASRWLYGACERAGVPKIALANHRQSRTKYLEGLGMSTGLIRYQLGHVGESTALTVRHYLGCSPSPSAIALMFDAGGSRKPPHRAQPVGNFAAKKVSIR